MSNLRVEKEKAGPRNLIRVTLNDVFGNSNQEKIRGKNILSTVSEMMSAHDNCYLLDFENRGITVDMLNCFGGLDDNIAGKITHLYIRNNELTDTAAPLIANIMIQSTYANNKIPDIGYLTLNSRKKPIRNAPANNFRDDTIRTLNSIERSLDRYLTSKLLSKIIQTVGMVLSVFTGLGIILFNGACLAVLAGVHSPLLALIAALTTFVGGSMGVSLIGIALLGTVNIVSTACRSFFENRKNAAMQRASNLRGELTRSVEPNDSIITMIETTQPLFARTHSTERLFTASPKPDAPKKMTVQAKDEHNEVIVEEEIPSQQIN